MKAYAAQGGGRGTPARVRAERFLACSGALLSLLAAPLGAEIFTVFADSVPVQPSATFPTYGLACNVSGFCHFDGQSLDRVPPEGFSSWKTVTNLSVPNAFVGWGLSYDQTQDLSRFGNGELRFWIYSTLAAVKIDVKNNFDPANVNNPNNFILTVDLRTPPHSLGSKLNQWVPIRIPLSARLRPLTDVKNPFLATALAGPSTFYIDNVRYVDSTVSPVYAVSVHNVSDNAPASQVTWDATALPARWARADQYLKLDVDPDAMSWGVQIYTDNTASDAAPAFVPAVPAGEAGSNPAGLVDTASPNLRLPMAWSIKATTRTALSPVAADPNAGLADPNSFQWLYLQDRATPAIAAENTAAFQDGALFSVVRNNRGIHYGQSDLEIGAENSPNYIYLQADFTTAMTPRAYKTSTLRVEYFYP